jgi:hypothetical protein
MMSMVGAAVAPDTTAALVLGDDPLHGGKGFDRRRWPFRTGLQFLRRRYAALHESLPGPSLRSLRCTNF